MNWQEQLTKAMTMLAAEPKSLFLGQSVRYPGHIMFRTLENVPDLQKIELPVMEETQMGMSIGLSLAGYMPVSIYPRINFLLCAMNQLVNHLDKLGSLSQGQWQPKVIVRTMIGQVGQLYPGEQHSGDYTDMLCFALNVVEVRKITRPGEVIETYQRALASPKSSIIIEDTEA